MDKIGWNYGSDGVAFSGALAITGSFFNFVFGSWDSLLSALLIFIVADFVAGFLAAAKNGALDSKVMFWGGVNKLLVLILVAVATVLDGVLPVAEPYIRTAVLWFYIGREGLSLVENYKKLGQKLPAFLEKLLTKMHDAGTQPEIEEETAKGEQETEQAKTEETPPKA